MLVHGIEVNCPLTDLNLKIAIITVTVILLSIRSYLVVTCGFCKRSTRMDGKTVIITGANSGIGKETTRELARRGAKVIMACRNTDTAKAVRDDIAECTGNKNIFVRKLDLSSQKSIRDFANEILETEEKLDVLIHNAGTAETSKKITEDGVEMTMATNHFGPFLLTNLLIDLLKKSAPSRIIVVASELYRFASVNLDKLNPTDTRFPLYLYYVSKYANIYFTRELAKRLEGSGVTANCLHPGMIDSGIFRNVPRPLNWGLWLIVKGFFKTPQQGCQTTVHLAVSSEVEGINGKYFMDCKERSLSTEAMNDEKAKKLWDASIKLVNLQKNELKI